MTTLVFFWGSHGSARAQDSLIMVLDFNRFIPEVTMNKTFTPVLTLYSVPVVRSVSLDYENQAGPFRRPQEPESLQSASFRAGGTQRTSRLIAAGEFMYKLQRDEGQQWRDTGHEADLQPFIWADNATGTWNRNHFHAAVTLTGNASNRRWHPGVSLRYEGGTGDRQNTPRPLYRFHRLHVQPAILYRSEKYALAFTLHYQQQTEDNEVGYYVTDSPLLYRLRGYGTFSRSPFVSGNRLLQSSTFGGSMEYLKGALTQKFVLATLRYQRTNGSLEEGTSVTTPAGEWGTQRISGIISRGIDRNQYQWIASLQADASFLSGTDPVFQAVNYYLNTLSFAPSLRYSLPFRWYVELAGEYTQRKQQDIVASTDAKLNRAGGSLSVFSRIGLCPRVSLYTLPAIGYYSAISSSLEITAPTEMSDALVRPDFDMLNKPWLHAGMEAGLDIRTARNSIRVAAHATNRRHSTISRTQFNLSLHYFIR